MAALSFRARVRLLVFAASVGGAVVAVAVGLPIAMRGLMGALEGEAELSAVLWAERVDKAEFARLASNPDATDQECDRMEEDARALVQAAAILSVAPANAYGLVKTRNNSTTGTDVLFSAVDRGERDWVAPGTPYNLVNHPDRLIPLDRTSSGVFDDQWGHWISGFAPVRTADGEVIGLLGVDLPYHEVEEQSRSMLFNAALFAMVAALLAGVVGDVIVVRFLAPVEQMRAFVAAVGSGGDPKALPVAGAGDMRRFAAELNAMALQVREREDLRVQGDRLRAAAVASQARFDAVAEGVRELNDVMDADVLLERFLSIAHRILTCDASAVYLLDGGELRLATAQCASLEARMGTSAARMPWRGEWTRAPVGGMAWHVLNTGKALVEEDAASIGSDRPYYFDRPFDQQFGYQTRAIMLLPMKASSGRALGVLTLVNPLGPKRDGAGVFTTEDVVVGQHLASLAAVGMQRSLQTRGVIMKMVRMSEVHDPSETGAHVQRVASFAAAIYDGWAAKRGVGEEQLNRTRDVLRLAALVHDVGKVGIPDAILKKPGKLSDSEFAIVKLHTIIGAKLFGERDSPFELAAAAVALHHHERWDGRGYPGPVQPELLGGTVESITGANLPAAGLKGEEIPLFARIVCLADVFDALTSRRQYKEPWPLERVIAEIRAGSGKQFDPELVEVFLERIEVIQALGRRFQTVVAGAGAAREGGA